MTPTENYWAAGFNVAGMMMGTAVFYTIELPQPSLFSLRRDAHGITSCADVTAVSRCDKRSTFYHIH